MTELSNKNKPDPSRTPIAIEKLFLTHTNPHGPNLPDGNDGQSAKPQHTLTAGVLGDVKIEIDHRPWMRVFRVTKWKKTTRTVGDKEVVDWRPMGKPFHIPDAWAVSVPAGE